MRRLSLYTAIALGIYATAVEAWLMRSTPDLRHGLALLICAGFTAAAVHGATLTDRTPAPRWLVNTAAVTVLVTLAAGYACTIWLVTGWPAWSLALLLPAGYLPAMGTVLALLWAQARLAGQSSGNPRHLGRGDRVNAAGQVLTGTGDPQLVWHPGETYQPARPAPETTADRATWSVHV